MLGLTSANLHIYIIYCFIIFKNRKHAIKKKYEYDTYVNIIYIYRCEYLTE